MQKGSFTLVILCSLLAACASPPKPPAPLLSENSSSFWRLTAFPGGPPIDDAALYFDGGGMNGALTLSAACGYSSWSMQIKDDVLSFSNRFAAATGLQCAATTAFEAVVKNVKRALADGEKLTLLNGTGQILFEAKRIEANGIEYRKWRLASFYGDEGMEKTEKLFGFNSARPAVFMHGAFIGADGCGYMTSSYVLNGDRLNIDRMPTLILGMCTDRAVKMSIRFSEALSGDRLVVKAGNKVILKTLTGHQRIVLVPWE
jgi:heat shock protein HslJ